MRYLLLKSALLFAFVLLLFASALVAQDGRPSAVFTVNEASDTVDATPGDGICADSLGNCTLRAAVTEANLTAARDTINFVDGLAITITLTRGQLSITNPLTITGPGARNLTIQRTTAPNSSLFRLFDVSASTEISGVTLKNGNASTGGAIRALANIVLRDMAMTGNQANAGGAVYFSDLPILVDSVIERCLINGNTARGQGGAVYTAPDTWVKIRSSTLTDNNSQQAGAIANNGWTILVNNTIVRNSARFWSQMVNSPGSTFVLVNNIVGLDAGRSNGSVSGSFGSFGGNIITNSRGSSGWNSNDFLEEPDPHLGNIANNGGPTDSIAPLPESPAIDRGNSCVVFLSGCDDTSDYNVRFDQRGYQRAFGRVDIGAIELNSVPTLTTQIAMPFKRSL